MAKHIEITFTKTYATEANAHKAVAKVIRIAEDRDLRYIVQPVIVDGAIRYGVLFIGNSSFAAGVHFHFNCVN